jgi:hypothetical protein
MKPLRTIVAGLLVFGIQRAEDLRADGEMADVGLEVGNLFPTIQLPTLNGDVKSIEDYRGKKIILHVFASW